MCNFSHPDEPPNIHRSQCPHGTIHLTVGRTTLHISAAELIALHEELSRVITRTDVPPPDRHHPRWI